MASEEEDAPRRTSRAKIKTLKGEEYELSKQGSSPTSPPFPHEKKYEMFAARAGTKRAGVVLHIGPVKKSKKSCAVEKVDEMQPLLASSSKIPLQGASHTEPDWYQLPTFENILIGNAPFFPDGAESDWLDIDGNIDHYKGSMVDQHPKNALCKVVASTFVSRAKTAHESNLSWNNFEETERRIDSAAVTETNPQKRRFQRRNGLDNGLRLAILDKLAPRLCREIWGTPYIPSANGSPTRSAGRGIPPLPVQQREKYEDSLDRTVREWVTGGLLGAIPVYKSDESPESSVDLNDSLWLNQEDLEDSKDEEFPEGLGVQDAPGG